MDIQLVFTFFGLGYEVFILAMLSNHLHKVVSSDLFNIMSLWDIRDAAFTNFTDVPRQLHIMITDICVRDALKDLQEELSSVNNEKNMN